MTAPFSLGQLVRFANLRPDDDGRSLNGVLARVSWLPKKWDPSSPSLFVEYYRRHRRTRKPLGLKTTAVSFMKLEPAGELTREEAELLELVEPLRRDQRRRRAQMHADRLGWEERILAMEKGIVMLAKRGQAAEGITELERILTANPPAGVSAAEIADFFERQRPNLIEALLTILRLRAPRDRDREIHGIVTGHSRPS